MEYVKGVSTSCEGGDLVVTGFGQSNSATHWTDMSVPNEGVQC